MYFCQRTAHMMNGLSLTQTCLLLYNERQLCRSAGEITKTLPA